MIPFVKAHACGNDFLIVEEPYARGRHAELARRLCARETCVGADGVEFLDRRSDGTLWLRLFNADGSEAELSGNGTRCVAAWLAVDQGMLDVTLHTQGGPRGCKTLQVEGEAVNIATKMGVPSVSRKTVEVAGVGLVDGVEVNVGNPHFVVFTGAADFSSHGLSWEQLGAKICVHPDFAAGTNVEFVRVISEDEIAFRIFERGVGPTQSSGTGTCASSAASIVTRGCRGSLTARSLGGVQQVVWSSVLDEMELTGQAEIVCVGQVGTGEVLQ